MIESEAPIEDVTSSHASPVIPAVRLVEVVKEFSLHRTNLAGPREVVHAVAGVNLEVAKGQTFGLVGESGSGKSTLGRLILRLEDVTSGTIEIDGRDITQEQGKQLRKLRRNVQMVFQDPYSSFDPLAPIGESIGEPLQTHFQMRGTVRKAKVARLLDQVGLHSQLMDRFPSELSGGQLQRAAVARALAVEPDLLVLDEPVSALDVSTQAQVINLLQSLQRDLNIAYIFIAHDLSVVHHISDIVAVMYLGRLVEVGPVSALFAHPAHPYTAALLSAIPVPDPVRQKNRRLQRIAGDIPSPTNPPSGCRFRTRCPHAMEICTNEDPPPFVTPLGATVHCHLHQHGPQLRGASVLTIRPASGRTDTETDRD